MASPVTFFHASTFYAKYIGAMCCSLYLLCVTAVQADTVLLFAAASTGQAFERTVELYEARSADSVRVSLAASSTLAVQIANGAPADIFVSANVKWMDYLATRGAILPESRFDFLGNQLALITNANIPNQPTMAIMPNFALAAALGGRRLAIADPDHVPVGMYAKAALTSLGVWQTVESQVAPTANVRAAVELVARGETLLGISNVSDTFDASNIRIVDRFPPHTHPPIVYPVAQVAGGKAKAGLRFIDFLRSDEVRSIFTRYGFKILADGNE